MQSLTIRCYLKRFSKSVSPLTLLLLLILFSGFRDFLETDEDPTEVHHVNVISGKLHLVSEDHAQNFGEKSGSQTYGTETLNELQTTILDLLDTHAPNAKALHIAHSEAGVIYNRSFESMKDEDMKRMQRYFYCKGIGPAEPIPDDYGIRVSNVYSRHDFITGLFAKLSTKKCEV